MEGGGGGYVIKTLSFEVEGGRCRQRPPTILPFGGSCSIGRVWSQKLSAPPPNPVVQKQTVESDAELERKLYAHKER